MSEPDELISAVGVDYAPLRNFLASGQWHHADEETGAVMLKIARRVKAGWLREEDIQEFPCPDLQTIDQLWVKYSQGRFGFSVQQRIWEGAGEDYAKFSDSVGWRTHYSWQQWWQYSDLIFSLEAPVGRLPAKPFFKSGESPIGWLSSLAPKLVDCYAEDF